MKTSRGALDRLFAADESSVTLSFWNRLRWLWDANSRLSWHKSARHDYRRTRRGLAKKSFLPKFAGTAQMRVMRRTPPRARPEWDLESGEDV